MFGIIIFVEPTYKESLGNIIESLEDELNNYYSELKSITLDKLHKNFELMEINMDINYNKKVDEIINDVIY